MTETAGVRYDCGSSCKGIFKKKSTKEFCRKVRDCACGCGVLNSYSPALHDSCVQECNSSPETALTGEEFLAQFTPEDLWRRFQITVDGFDPRELVEHELLEDALERDDIKKENDNKLILYAGGALFFVVIIFLFR